MLDLFQLTYMTFVHISNNNLAHILAKMLILRAIEFGYKKYTYSMLCKYIYFKNIIN